MWGSWSAELSYSYLERLLDAIRGRYELRLLRDGPAAPDDPPRAILRHDIDVSLRAALEMAEREAEWGVRSTYLVQVDCPLYRLDDAYGRDVMSALVAMRHEVGLHVGLRAQSPDGLEERVRAAREELEALMDAAVESVSFHRPPSGAIRGPRRVSDMVNAYAAELMGAYISDSEGRFRDGDPLRSVCEAQAHTFQLLTHPIWWGDAHLSPGDRLQELFEERSRGLSSQQVKTLDDDLFAEIGPAVRSGCA